ncbi:hypothetical protein [Tautonia sociabilis]|nr:hypothetical protein [Tautonia sociabilis]
MGPGHASHPASPVHPTVSMTPAALLTTGLVIISVAACVLLA